MDIFNSASAPPATTSAAPATTEASPATTSAAPATTIAPPATTSAAVNVGAAGCVRRRRYLRCVAGGCRVALAAASIAGALLRLALALQLIFFLKGAGTTRSCTRIRREESFRVRNATGRNVVKLALSCSQARLLNARYALIPDNVDLVILEAAPPSAHEVPFHRHYTSCSVACAAARAEGLGCLAG